MAKKLIISILIIRILLCTVCLAQRQKVDSLKKVLPLLHDSARVDCLNALVEVYLKINEPVLPIQHRNIVGDTASNYAKLAYEESEKINYITGIAESLTNLAVIETVKLDFPAEEKLSREAIYWYRKNPQKKRLPTAYYVLSRSLYAQSEFAEAIKNSDTAFYWQQKNGDLDGMYWTLMLAHYTYNAAGNYEKCFEVAKQCIDLAMQMNNDSYKREVWFEIADLFMAIGDYEKGLEYYRMLNVGPRIYAGIFISLQQYDSAKYYYTLYYSRVDTSDATKLLRYLGTTGDWYFVQEQYDKALSPFIRALDFNRQINDINQVMKFLKEIAKTYLALGYADSAFKYGIEAYTIAKQKDAKQFVRDASEILAEVYEHWNRPDSAYFYYKQYTTIKDSVQNNVLKGKLAAYDFDRKMELINKEKQIQQVQLQKQSLLKDILIGCIIILLLMAAIIFRNVILKRKNEANLRELAENELQIQKLEHEKTTSELQQQKTELEMQALRAQMNPHFIFNSLNSINRFILQNDRARASEFLTKFSKLVRMILQNSQASLITLESELESLKLYLELEAVRFNYHFDYKTSVPKDLDIEVLRVPPLIIQPYVENAIWHGLMHKEEKGHLDIEVSQDDGLLNIKITDNGIGRKKASELTSKSATKHKSMGLQITAHRIAMMQGSNGNGVPVKITDLINEDGSAAGTEVVIKMPAIYN